MIGKRSLCHGWPTQVIACVGQLWKENSDTAKGREAHKRVHTSRIERRGDHLQLFEYDVFSKELNIGGKCDCIEAMRDAGGCLIPAAEFPVRLYPVE